MNRAFAVVTPRLNRRESANGSVARGAGVRAARRVVTVAGACDQLAAAARRDDLDLDSAERAIALGIGRVVRECVLISDVVRDLLADVVHVFHIFRKVSQTTGSFSDFFERTFCALGALFALLA